MGAGLVIAAEEEGLYRPWEGSVLVEVNPIQGCQTQTQGGPLRGPRWQVVTSWSWKVGILGP